MHCVDTCPYKAITLKPPFQAPLERRGWARPRLLCVWQLPNRSGIGFVFWGICSPVSKHFEHTSKTVLFDHQASVSHPTTSELEADERLDASKRHPNVAEVTRCKRLLLTQEILEDFGYEDVGALQILREGATLAGKVDPSAAFEAQFRRGILTVQQLEASAPRRNVLVLRLATPHEDSAVDEQLWRVGEGLGRRAFSIGVFGGGRNHFPSFCVAAEGMKKPE